MKLPEKYNGTITRPNIEGEYDNWCLDHQRSISSRAMFKVVVEFMLYLEKAIILIERNRQLNERVG